MSIKTTSIGYLRTSFDTTQVVMGYVWKHGKIVEVKIPDLEVELLLRRISDYVRLNVD
jgi:hypothetical protein